MILRDLYRDKEFLRYGMLIYYLMLSRDDLFQKRKQSCSSFQQVALLASRGKQGDPMHSWGGLHLSHREVEWSNIFRRFCIFLLNFSSSQTYRSDFWRNQKPMYVEEGERVTRRMSMMEDTQTRMKRGPDKTALFTIRLNIWSSLFALWSLILITQVFSHNDYLPVLKLESRVSINNFWAR